MMISLSFTSIAAIIFIAAACFLLLGEGSSTRRLRERVLATREVKVEVAGASADTIIDLAEDRNLFLRWVEFLGYRPNLPPPYTMSLKIVGLTSLIAAVGVMRVLQAVLPIIYSIPIAILAALCVAALLFRRKISAYRAMLFKQIPDTMSLMLRAVRAGLPVAEAIRSVSRESLSPTRDEFNRVAGEAALGMPIEMTLHRLHRRTQIQEYAFFSVVIGLHGQTGGNLSETLENLADMVRRRVAMAAKGKALAAEGRLSAIVIAALPFVVGVLISFVNPGYMQEFVTNDYGPMMIATFFILLLFGIISSYVLIQRSTQD